MTGLTPIAAAQTHGWGGRSGPADKVHRSRFLFDALIRMSPTKALTPEAPVLRPRRVVQTREIGICLEFYFIAACERHFG